MTDIGTFTEPNNKTVPLLPWEPRNSEFKVQKNDSLALLKSSTKNRIFKKDRCLLALTTFTSHMQICFKIDFGLIKLSNV